MKSDPLSAAEVKKWSVDDVGRWLEDLGLAHKVEAVKTAKLSGDVLVTPQASTKLQEAGFSGLQIRKIISRLPDASSENSDVVKTSGASASSGEVAALRSEIEDLKEQVRKLTILVKQQPITTTKPTSNVAVDDMKMSQQVLGFCTDCVILGHQTQILQVTLGPGESLQAEPGSMLHQSDYIEMTAKTGGQGLERFLTGQKIFVSEFTYHGPAGTADTVVVTPDFPGQIIPVRISDYSGCVICQRGSLLACSPTIQVDIEFSQTIGAGFFGGEGFVLQGLRGPGMAFLNARGVVVKMNLRAGEVRRVSTGCLVAFEQGVQYRVAASGRLGTMLAGGEGVFVTELIGPGTVWLESHDMSRLYKEMHAEMNKSNGWAN